MYSQERYRQGMKTRWLLAYNTSRVMRLEGDVMDKLILEHGMSREAVAQLGLQLGRYSDLWLLLLYRTALTLKQQAELRAAWTRRG